MFLQKLLPVALLAIPSLAVSQSIVFTNAIIADQVAGANDVAAGDFDGDGLLDVVVLESNADNVLWLRNPGGDLSGEWVETRINSAFGNGASVGVGDFDDDGDLDVAAASPEDNDIAWFENPAGTAADWEEHILDPAAMAVSDIEVVDIDGDGDLDIVATATGDNDVLLFRNPGRELVRDEDEWIDSEIDNNLQGATGLSIGDIDGDNLPDVVACGPGTNDLVWYRNPGGEEIGDDWPKFDIVTNVTNPSDSVTGDFDNDGTLDVIVCLPGRDDVVAFFGQPGMPEERFEEVEIVSDSMFDGVGRIEAADFDNDGDLDIVASAFGADDVLLLENPGSELARDEDSWIALNVTPLNGAAGATVADFDGSGSLDIASAGSDANDVVISLNPTVISIPIPVISSISELDAGGFQITWAAEEGIVYRIDSSADLTFAEDGFGELMDPATAGAVTVDIPAMEGAERLFYRVVAVSR